MHNLVCPRCGTTNDREEFAGPFCLQCAPIKLICPKEFSIEVCPKCGRMRVAREWIRFDPQIIAKLLKRKCKGKIEKMEYDPHSGKAAFFITRENSLIRLERTIKFAPIKNICVDCSRRGSNYFESIIQLRGRPERIAKYEKLLTSSLSESTFITKSEQLKEGKDLYVGSSKAVIAVLNELGMKVTITRTLHGQKQG
ncbi:MAG TPA: NMD3-related protein, partial [Candidatus Bilamarchaeaceae archaeon]|nr:NMD3-related protein [Candidatus Bilamarchaeaceae archaeon]